MADLLTNIREQLASRLEAGLEAVEEVGLLRHPGPGRPRASRTDRNEDPDPVACASRCGGSSRARC